MMKNDVAQDDPSQWSPRVKAFQGTVSMRLGIEDVRAAKAADSGIALRVAPG
jgi:hypothetical protein